MNAAPVALRLTEWETLTPENCTDLAGRFLSDDRAAGRAAERLDSAGMLRFRETRRGLEIQATSYVGRIQLGDLSITIVPKIREAALLRLLRYAYGFRRLHLLDVSPQGIDQCGFEDLLVQQLNAEVHELISRGLIRQYVATVSRLAAPCGRIDIAQIARDGGVTSASLPCQHFPRSEDILLNQTLAAGLHLAAEMASAVELRRESRRLAVLFADQVRSRRLDSSLLEQAALRINRLTRSYEPSLTIIRLLHAAQGVVLEDQRSVRLPGFLFNMNAFFQALLSRFLRENLPDHELHDEFPLRGMMRYHPQFNPRREQAPSPRPDFVVTRHGKVAAILDAKYRDLWAKHLPREMLYQLVIYAVSLPQRPQSVILYPSHDIHAREARIDVADPFHRRHIGQVCLRPVHLPTLDELVASDTAASRRVRIEFARRLTFAS